MTSHETFQLIRPRVKKKKKITLFSQSDPIVLQEDDLQAISNNRVIIDDVSDGRDQFDDHLGGVVAWGRLEEVAEQVSNIKSVCEVLSI